MSNRACPLCFAKMRRVEVLAQSEELTCPSCGGKLELSRPSRVWNAFVGGLAGFFAASLVFHSGIRGAWALGLPAAVLAFGGVSALMLFLLSDLVLRPKEAAPFPHPPK